MIHSSNYKPSVIPVLADLEKVEIDRLQELSATVNLNRTKIEEIGRDGNVGWKVSTPSTTVNLRQYEYGNIEFFRKIANKGDSVATINFTDLKTSLSDIVAYKTDDSGTFLGSVYYPNLRISSFGLSIGDPDAIIERSFSMVGEDEIVLLNDNKYLIHKRNVISAGLNQTVTLSDPTPAADPDESGQYLFKVVRVRAGVATELEHGTDWSYNGAGALTINGTSVAGDVIKAWYSASAYIGGTSTFTQNDTDAAAINADSVSIYLQTSNYVYRLQNVTVDTTLDRTDYKEIGNDDIVLRGARDITHRITLGRFLEAYTIEEILRGKGGLSYGKISAKKYEDNLSLIIKVYSDSTKSTFKYGYKFTDLAPTGFDAATPVSDYINRNATLEGESGIISTSEGVL